MGTAVSIVFGIIIGLLIAITAVLSVAVIVLSRQERKEIFKNYAPDAFQPRAEILSTSTPDEVYDKFFRE